MPLGFLFRTKPKHAPVSEVLAKPVITEQRQARSNRRRRPDRRKERCQTYMGVSKRETIDRREVVAERRFSMSIVK